MKRHRPQPLDALAPDASTQPTSQVGASTTPNDARPNDLTSGHGDVEQALRASEVRYRQIFELAVDGILQGSPTGIITGANAQMQKLAGRSLEQLLGLHVSDLFAPAELNAKPLRFDLLDEALHFVHERNLTRPDGTSIAVEMHSKRMPDGTYQSIYRDISERKQAEVALRESNELLLRFMRDSPIYSYIKTVTPHESRVFLASENFQDMIGIAGSEMVGKTMDELFPADLAAKVTADDWRVASSGEMLNTIEHLHGRHYSTIKFPIIQGSQTLLAGYTIDITERIQAEQILREWNQTLELRVAERTQELQQSEARFRELAAATFEGIAITEGDRLIDGNAQFAEIHGWELADMVGRPVADFVAPDSHVRVTEHLRDGDEIAYEFVGLRKDGSTFPAEAHARMMTWHGKRTRVSALRDLTIPKQTAARLLAQQTELETAQRLALLSEVSAGIIHQIGQPLCAMGANLAAASVRLRTCQLKRCGTITIIKDVEADVARLRDVVTHLRALAHPEQPTREPVVFNELVAGVIGLLRQEAESRNVLLVVEFGDGLPPLLADAVQLSQVILNLARNAFDACASCPPERRKVTITTRVPAAETLELSVHDTGTGISPEVMTRGFAAFFTTKAKGLGIGLRLSQTIVQAHGGHIEGSNNPAGEGATFRVVLPANLA
jgi:PAS domain S-box-containing protein